MTAIKTTLDAAIAAGKAGHKVFPCIENGKIPAVGGWQQKATTDEAKIRAMWTDKDPVLGDRIKNYNIGISTEGLLVLDVDNKNGKRGDAALEELDLFHGIPKTFEVTTPTGGRHLYFAPEASVANSAGRLGLGLDVRGDGGYVVGPGSVIDGKAYEGNFYPMAEAPKWLEEAAGRPAARSDKGKVVELLDTTGAVQRARKFLETAEPATEGQGGDAHTFKIAAKIKDLGVSELTALELMDEVWNPRCSPPWDFEHLATKVSNAYHYGKRPVGEMSPEADFHAVSPSEDIPTVKKPKRLSIILPTDVTIIRRSLPIVKGWIDEESFVVTYGDSNVGKSFLNINMQAHIALGKPWAKRKVTQGATVYIAAEGGRSSQLRIAALKKFHEVDNFPLALIASPVDLCNPAADVQELYELLLEEEKRIGKIRYVTIDTLARAMAGGNENSPDDMGAYIKNCDTIRERVRTVVDSIHHKGKDNAKGMRGHSSLFAAADTVIEVERGLATAVKQRDMDTGDAVEFDLREIELGKDEDGEPITSAVAVAGDTSASLDFGGNPARNALVMRALRDAIKANEGKAVSWETWQSLCNKYILEGETVGFEGAEIGGKWQSPGNSTNKALRTIRDTMCTQHIVKMNKRKQWIIV